MRRRVFTKSPVRENCTPGSVRGLSGNRQSYRDLTGRLRLHDRRQLLAQGRESIEAWQTGNAAGHCTIENLQTAGPAKQSRDYIIGIAFRLGPLTDGRPELAHTEPRQVARKFGLAQFQPG